MKWTAFLSLAALAFGAMSQTTSAQVTITNELIFRDTFDVSAQSNDVNFENNLRQSGNAAPLAYSEKAPTDDLTQVGAPDAPGRLRLQSSSYVSPNHNFTEGGRFTIEFDVDPGIDDTGDPLSSDWCGVVFGSSSQNPFIFSSDGLGILFRNSGNIEVWETRAQGAIYSASGDYPGGIPTGTNFHVRIEVDTADFSGTSPATIKMFVNNIQVRIDNNTLQHVQATGFRNNFITLEGLGGTPGPWVHVFDNLTVSSVPCIRVSPENVDKIQGQTSDPLTVTVPRQLNATQAAQMIITSLNTNVAVPVGADANGRLTLNFPTGGTNAQSFTVSAVGPGVTSLILSNAQGACVINSVLVTVASGVGVPEVLFQDNFNVSAMSSDVNFENNLGRQNGGAVGALSYSERPDTAAGGLLDDFRQLNTPDAPGKLVLNITDFVWVSPNYNFADGSDSTLEFKVNPGANK